MTNRREECKSKVQSTSWLYLFSLVTAYLALFKMYVFGGICIEKLLYANS